MQMCVQELLRNQINSENRCRGIMEDQIKDATFMEKEDHLLTFNVSGMAFESFTSTIEAFPTTLLGDKQKREKHYVDFKQAYFFDTSRKSFESILYYYQSGGHLVCPAGMPLHVFEEEVKFFSLTDDVMKKLMKNEEYIIGESDDVNENDTINDIRKNSDASPLKQNPRPGWKLKIWRLFENPRSSRAAQIVSSLSLLMIAVSITIFCMETLPFVREGIHEDFRKLGYKVKNHKLDEVIVSFYHGNGRVGVQPWFSLEMTCVVWFTVEYIVRFIVSPSKRSFLQSPLNTMDLLSILPYFAGLAISQGSVGTSLSALRVFRLIRVFRIFKLSRYTFSAEVFAHTIRSSVNELGMLLFFLLIGVVVFSTLLFTAEKGWSDTYESIPHTFWYCLVSMTTVGYGDQVPVTVLGKLIGGACAVTGVLFMALPVPFIVKNFEYFYNHYRVEKLSKKKKTIIL